MDAEEVRNELLAKIHNRLAEISKFLEIGIAIFAKLSAYDLDDIKSECKNINIKAHDIFNNDYSLLQDKDMRVGCNSSMGLHQEFWSKGEKREVYWPLGEDTERTCPIDEDGYLLTDNKQEAE